MELAAHFDSSASPAPGSRGLKSALPAASAGQRTFESVDGRRFPAERAGSLETSLLSVALLGVRLLVRWQLAAAWRALRRIAEGCLPSALVLDSGVQVRQV